MRPTLLVGPVPNQSLRILIQQIATDVVASHQVSPLVVLSQGHSTEDNTNKIVLSEASGRNRRPEAGSPNRPTLSETQHRVLDTVTASTTVKSYRGTGQATHRLTSSGRQTCEQSHTTPSVPRNVPNKQRFQ